MGSRPGLGGGRSGGSCRVSASHTVGTCLEIPLALEIYQVEAGLGAGAFSHVFLGGDGVVCLPRGS